MMRLIKITDIHYIVIVLDHFETEAGFMLKLENNDRKINYINCLLLPNK